MIGLALADGTLESVAEPTAHAAERVLIVDDDPATRNGLTELVRAWGFTAESAGDGAEALERVTDFRPSIIVSDMVMPKMSGLDLLKALAGARIHRADALELYAPDQGVITGLAERLEKRMAFELSRSDGHAFVTIAGTTLSGEIERLTLAPA